jgi:hypothetical protein
LPLGVDDIQAPVPGEQAELESRPALHALAEVLDAIPDPITCYAAYTLLAPVEQGSARTTPARPVESNYELALGQCQSVTIMMSERRTLR